MLVVSPIMSAGEESRPERLHGLMLARSTVDRAGDLRTDSSKLDSLWRSAKILVLVKDRFHATDTALIFHDSISIHGIGERYFLGIDRETGVSYFVWHTDEEIIEEDDLRALRQIGAMLSDTEAGLAVHALGLANWHHTHPCCSRCGAKTKIALGGAVRRCEVDGSEHHPRTDPAVIVLVKDKDDRLLLGRQRVWVEKLFSNFAGFVEPGESFEQGVVREVLEESGVLVHSVHYLGSQPWPFPASIMIAFEAITSEPDVARPDGEEIVELRWYSREEMHDAVKSGELTLPSQISVSRRMIEHWYGAGAVEDLSTTPGLSHG
ncbi:MAG: NAD(+) diphosphatase [Candidatus Nanopelagicaceae bacterium]|nr:NAD(+) diphosphatase [Candidatus Nanopelagicaceae bacterium]